MTDFLDKLNTAEQKRLDRIKEIENELERMDRNEKMEHVVESIDSLKSQIYERARKGEFGIINGKN